MSDLEKRVARLERLAHRPFDFAPLIERVERLERAAGIEPPAPQDPEPFTRCRHCLCPGPAHFEDDGSGLRCMGGAPDMRPCPCPGFEPLP